MMILVNGDDYGDTLLLKHYTVYTSVAVAHWFWTSSYSYDYERDDHDDDLHFRSRSSSISGNGTVILIIVLMMIIMINMMNVLHVHGASIHRHSCACDDYCDDNDDEDDDWNQYQFRIPIPNSMHFCLLPMMPHGLLTSVYVSARRLLTPFISLSNTRLPGQISRKDNFIVWSQDRAVFPVWSQMGNDDDSKNGLWMYIAIVESC